MLFLFPYRRAKLMEMLLRPSSHYQRVRNYLHPLNLSQLHQRERLQNLIVPVLTLRKLGPGAQERVRLCLYFFVIAVIYALYGVNNVISFSKKAITTT